jgi:hypothetical protein
VVVSYVCATANWELTAPVTSKLPRLILTFVGALLIALTLARAVPSWRNDSHIEHVSAIWVALAVDVNHGVFYRAPFGPRGYGGTRFFPLYFCVHALGIKLFHGWRASGYSLSAASGLLLLAGVYYLLRRLGADRWLAFSGTLAILAGASVQDSLLTIREDGMASMLNVWGVALCARDNFSWHRLGAAAVLFSLAFATKETTVFGIAAVLLCLLVDKNFRDFWRLSALTATGCVLVLAIMYLASNGRAFQVLRLTAASGVSLRNVLNSPITLVQTLNGYVAESGLLVLAAGALLVMLGHRMLRFYFLLFICTLAVTFLIFSSEGTAGNHLLDLHVAAVVLFVAWVAEASLNEFGVAALAAVCLIAWLSLLPQHKEVDFVPVRAQLQEVVRAIGPSNRPILAENPLVPITAGQIAYVMDPFMFRVMREKDPSLAEPMFRMLREKQFAAVVLMDDPDSDYGRDLYSRYHFGEGFIEQMRENYAPAGTPGEEYVYLPR